MKSSCRCVLSSLCNVAVSISSGTAAETSLNSYLTAWTSGTRCNGTVVFTVAGTDATTHAASARGGVHSEVAAPPCLLTSLP